MKTKSLGPIAVFASLFIGVAFFNLGCKDDDSPATPSGPNAPYGSGTITATSSAGSLSITGTGGRGWPLPAGSSVRALYDTSAGSHRFFVGGYQQVSGPNYNAVELLVRMPAGVVTGTYNHPNFGFIAAYDFDTSSHGGSEAYGSFSGSIIVDSVRSSNVFGRYTLMARKPTGPAIQFTGTFDVTYVVASDI